MDDRAWLLVLVRPRHEGVFSCSLCFKLEVNAVPILEVAGQAAHQWLLRFCIDSVQQDWRLRRGFRFLVLNLSVINVGCISAV